MTVARAAARMWPSPRTVPSGERTPITEAAFGLVAIHGLPDPEVEINAWGAVRLIWAGRRGSVEFGFDTSELGSVWIEPEPLDELTRDRRWVIQGVVAGEQVVAVLSTFIVAIATDLIASCRVDQKLVATGCRRRPSGAWSKTVAPL